MQQLNVNDIKSVILSVKKLMDENYDYLIELDSAMGDGDLGITMTKAFTAANDEAQRSTEMLPGKLLIMSGMAMAKAAPSTMGTLMATGFMKGGKAIAEVEVIGLHELSTFFNAFTTAIMERGKSKPGNKTIIDVLQPATIALQEADKNNKSLSEAIKDAFVAAQQGLEDSKQMKAQHGRAAYYQDKSIGKQDAGATAGMLLVKGFYTLTIT